MTDHTSRVINQWASVRPDVDTTAMEVIARLLRASKIIEARLDAVASAIGMNHKGDLDVLTTLRRIGPPHQQTPTLLAHNVQLTTGGMTSRLDRLERAGLVVRSPDPSDRRGILVSLTDAGFDKADKAFELLVDAQNSLLGALTANQRQESAKILECLMVSLGDTGAGS